MDGWDVAKAVSADDESSEEKRIIAEMNEPGGEDGSGAGAHESKDDADDNQQGDLREAAPELRRVHEAEKHSGDDDSGGDSPFTREDGIQKAAEDGFFDERRDSDAENHQPDHGGA